MRVLICPEGGSVISTAHRRSESELHLAVLCPYLSEYLDSSTNATDFISVILFRGFVTKPVSMHLLLRLKFN